MTPRSFPSLKTDASGRSQPAAKPTNVRWHIIALLAVVSGLTYLDRLNLSIAGQYIQDEFALNTETMGWVLSAFVWGYSLSQVPGGWLGDRYGPRVVLTLAILWWSAFTAATAIAPRFPFVAWFGLPASFAIVRFLIGVGEAATFPNVSKVVAFWLGPAYRALGNSLPFAGIGLGGALTPVLIAWIMQRWGWRTTFYFCGVLGVVVALVWYWYATDRPEQHARVNTAELELIRSSDAERCSDRSPNPSRKLPPWGRMLSNSSARALITSAFCIGYPAYIFYTWFYIYLVRVRGLGIMEGGFWGSMPFLAIVLLAPLGGWFSDRAVARLGRRRGRQIAMWVGVMCSASLLGLGGHAKSNIEAIFFLAGAAGFNLFATATLWAACIDLAPNYSGSLSGLMNTVGTLGGALSPIITAYIATRRGWPQALDFAALITLSAGLLWIYVNTEESLEEEVR